MTELVVRAIGEPAPQGSFFAVLVRGRPTVVADNKATKPWRAVVEKAAKSAITAAGGWLPITDATEVLIVFALARPKSVKRLLPHVRPDLDKLARSTLDALTAAGVLADDATVTDLILRKRYAEGDTRPGARIVIRPVSEVLL